MIYLDNNATTSLDPNVKKVMLQEMEQPLGNPSSVHALGQAAKGRLTKARRFIADYLSVKPHEIIFTSGATEGMNMVMKGLCKPGDHLITSGVEHACTFEVAKYLESIGVEVTFLPVGAKGCIEIEDLKASIKTNTRLIALMSVNNETGVKNDVEAIAQVAEQNNLHFLVDGVASLGKEQITVYPGITAICFSGHKAHAPAGIGFLFLRHKVKLSPFILGGSQEFQKRGGTENFLGAIALGEAVRLLSEIQPRASEQMLLLRDRFEQALMDQLEDVSVNGLGERVVNTSNLCFKGVDGESLLAHLDMAGVFASHGSACSAGALEPSRVLINMGLSKEVASSSLRFSLSRMTKESEIDEAVSIIVGCVTKLRELTLNVNALDF